MVNLYDGKGNTILILDSDDPINVSELSNDVNANAIKRTTSDGVVSIIDASPIEHTMNVRVTGIEKPENVTIARCGKNIFGFNEDKSTTHNGLTIDFDSNKQEYTINGIGNKYARVSFSNIENVIFPVVNRPTTITLSMEYVDGSVSRNVTDCDVKLLGYIYHVDGKDHYVDDCFALPTTGKTHAKINIDQSYLQRGRIALCPAIMTDKGVVYDNYKFKLQLEVGDVATEYESYTCEIYTPNADGIVEGVASLYPNTTLFTSVNDEYSECIPGIIECEYNQDTNKVLEKVFNLIDSISKNVE